MCAQVSVCACEHTSCFCFFFIGIVGGWGWGCRCRFHIHRRCGCGLSWERLSLSWTTSSVPTAIITATATLPALSLPLFWHFYCQLCIFVYCLMIQDIMHSMGGWTRKMHIWIEFRLPTARQLQHPTRVATTNMIFEWYALLLLLLCIADCSAISQTPST